METLSGITTHGKDTALDQEATEAFAERLRGLLIRSDDEAYEAGCAVYNAMIDKRPALIARCQNTADVISSVNFAREHELLLVVRSGGHNGAGLGSVDDGLVIDLSEMNGIRVDPEGRRPTSKPAAHGAVSITPRTRSGWQQ